MVSSSTWWSKCHLKGTGYTTHIKRSALRLAKSQNISAIHFWEVVYIYIYTHTVYIYIYIWNNRLCYVSFCRCVHVLRFRSNCYPLPFFIFYSAMQSTCPGRCPSTAVFGTMISVQYVSRSSPADNQASAGRHNRFSVSLQPGRSIKMTCEGQNKPWPTQLSHLLPGPSLANWPSKTLSTKHGQMGSTGAKADRTFL